MKYKIKNWSEYNKSLINRGSLTFWFTEEGIKGWMTILKMDRVIPSDTQVSRRARKIKVPKLSQKKVTENLKLNA